MKTNAFISIANDFSRVPLGRYLSDGPFNGEKFREEYLYPLLSNTQSITIDFGGVYGYASSWLEEAFGGLRRKGFSEEFLNENLQFISIDDPTITKEILNYFKEYV